MNVRPMAMKTCPMPLGMKFWVKVRCQSGRCTVIQTPKPMNTASSRILPPVTDVARAAGFRRAAVIDEGKHRHHRHRRPLFR